MNLEPEDCGWNFVIFYKMLKRFTITYLAVTELLGRWTKLTLSRPQVKISRVTLEPYCFKTCDELVVAWALCTNGSLLYRHGVTPNKPQGEEWVCNNS